MSLIMNIKYHYFIEVRVPNSPDGWNKIVNQEMRQALKKLKVAVEKLDGENLRQILK